MGSSPPPNAEDTVFAPDRATWRRWLRKHHANQEAVWLLLYKKHMNKRCIGLGEAVEEALCFGWIDGKLRRIDDQRHVVRFSPRRARSIWSASNRERVERLIRERRVTPAGLAAVEAAKANGRWEAAEPSQELEMPKDLLAALKRKPLARRFFAGLAPGYRRMYVGWVLDARRAETRARRVQTVVERCLAGLKPGV